MKDNKLKSFKITKNLNKMKNQKMHEVRVFNSLNIKDEGFVIATFNADEKTKAIKLEKEENKKNEASYSCEIAVLLEINN